MSFYTFKNRYFITGKIVAETPIHVGAQTSLMPTVSELPVLKTHTGLPYIPGSTLKGAVRAFTEKILRTLKKMNPKLDMWACNPLSEDGQCVNDRKKEKLVMKCTVNGVFNDEKFSKEILGLTCTACRIFGSKWVASRVLFKDALLTNSSEMIRLVEVRDGVAIDRDTGTAKSRMKFDYEAVPRGAEFSLQVVFENAEKWEVGLLLLALKSMGEGFPIGGIARGGLGWGTVNIEKVEVVSGSNLLSYLKTGEREACDPEELIDEFARRVG